MAQPHPHNPEVRLHDVKVEECWELISAGERVARVAWSTAGGPVLVPVNYVVHERVVWMRTSPYSALAREADDAPVAFETDDIDPTTHLGWSVLGRGTAEVIYDHDDVPEPIRTAHPWPAGHRPLWIRIAPRELTGRRLTAG
ncbi:pyridoxamine 5'-phosphate oxidase family protein [Nocardioides insulae]|uniref:pyridoxamine 5'-phosphate oxidase family protein n=1 Tax=Nocardioides insulae TaxID=394734 RepID=UPI0012F84FEB|nr:pyridoxamine 5'-phosphate oxidase family protein [Nocardioides insulae]